MNDWFRSSIRWKCLLQSRLREHLTQRNASSKGLSRSEKWQNLPQELSSRKELFRARQNKKGNESVKKIVLLVATVGSLGACEINHDTSPQGSSAPESDAALSAALSGRTLTLGANRINVGADGTLSGSAANGAAILGAWSIRNGKWCRTLSSPEAMAGSACQRLAIEADKVAINGTIYTID